MAKEKVKISLQTKINILNVVLVLIGGFILFALYWLIYVGIYLALESVFYSNNPTEFPAGILRISCSVGLFLLYIGVLFTKLPARYKAILSVAPNGIMIIMIVLAPYENVLLFLGISLLYVAISISVMIIRKVPWIYYVGAGYGFMIGYLYAWPR